MHIEQQADLDKLYNTFICITSVSVAVERINYTLGRANYKTNSALSSMNPEIIEEASENNDHKKDAMLIWEPNSFTNRVQGREAGDIMHTDSMRLQWSWL